MPVDIHRASMDEAADAFAMVQEYNEAIGVIVRDSRASFLRDYFSTGSGLWLAYTGQHAVGCIALRPLHEVEQAGEIKRLYVQPSWREQGIADALLLALEHYARDAGYRWLYLDSKDDLVPALRFYGKHGYKPCACYNANPQATVFMRKQIDCV